MTARRMTGLARPLVGSLLALSLVAAGSVVAPAQQSAAQESAARDGEAGRAAPPVFPVRPTSDQMLASGLGSVFVIGPDGETVGDVQDTLLTHDGRIAALVVGVGGLLGVGEKLVGVPYEHLTVRPIEDGIEFVTDLTRAQLDEAPVFKPKDE